MGDSLLPSEEKEEERLGRRRSVPSSSSDESSSWCEAGGRAMLLCSAASIWSMRSEARSIEWVRSVADERPL